MNLQLDQATRIIGTHTSLQPQETVQQVRDFEVRVFLIDINDYLAKSSA